MILMNAVRCPSANLATVAGLLAKFEALDATARVYEAVVAAGGIDAESLAEWQTEAVRRRKIADKYLDLASAMAA